MRGPVPKRSDQRRRRNTPEVEVTTLASKPAKFRPPSKSWHPTARAWYRAFAASAQVDRFQQTDCETAYVGADVLTDYYETGKAEHLKVWTAINAELLGTEGARLRQRVEVERQSQQVAPAKPVGSRDRDRKLLEAV